MNVGTPSLSPSPSSEDNESDREENEEKKDKEDNEKDVYGSVKVFNLYLSAAGFNNCF